MIHLKFIIISTSVLLVLSTVIIAFLRYTLSCALRPPTTSFPCPLEHQSTCLLLSCAALSHNLEDVELLYICTALYIHLCVPKLLNNQKVSCFDKPVISVIPAYVHALMLRLGGFCLPYASGNVQGPLYFLSILQSNPPWTT